MLKQGLLYDLSACAFDAVCDFAAPDRQNLSTPSNVSCNSTLPGVNFNSFGGLYGEQAPQIFVCPGKADEYLILAQYA